MAHLNAVLVVTNAVPLLPIELGDLKLVAIADGATVEVLRVPAGHLLQAFDHGLGAEFGCSSRGSVYPERCESPQEGTEGVRERQVRVVIDVKMADEYVVDQRNGHLGLSYNYGIGKVVGNQACMHPTRFIWKMDVISLHHKIWNK